EDAEYPLAALRAEAALVYADEPPCMHGVNALAYNAAMTAFDRPKKYYVRYDPGPKAVSSLVCVLAGRLQDLRREARQRKKRLAFCLSVFGFTNPPIGQTLSAGLKDDLGSALRVLDAEARAIVVTKIELGNVAMQVRFATVLIDALHAALENR